MHVTVVGAPAALIAPPVETTFERVPHIRATLLLIRVHLLLVVHPAVEVDLSLSLSLSLVGVLHVSSLLLPAVPGIPALLHRYPVPVGVVPEPGRAVLRAPRVVMLILRRALHPAELVRTVHAPTPAATHGVAPVRAGPANPGFAAVHAHVTHRARGTVHRRVGAARAAAEETIIMHERSGVPAPAALARSPVVEHTPVNGALLVPLIAAAGQDAARLRTERLERALQPALLRLEAPPRPPRDAKVAADSFQGCGSHAEVLCGVLQVFVEVLRQHTQGDSPRRLLRSVLLGVPLPRRVGGLVESTALGAVRAVPVPAHAHRTIVMGHHALTHLLLVRHPQLRGALQVVPQALHALLLLLRRGQVGREEHLEDSLDGCLLRGLPVRLTRVRGFEQNLARARAVKSQERRGVLQRPLHLRTLLHVIHPDHGSLLESLTHRPLALLDGNLLRDLPVGHGQLILHAERRARGDQFSLVRHPALREGELEAVAHVLERHRV